jgi:hypothetical protein
VWLFFFGGLFLHTGLMLCYFWGKWDDPVVQRLSLPCHLWWALSVVQVWPNLVKARFGMQWATAGAGLFLIGYTIPSASAHRYTHLLVSGLIGSWIDEFARHQPKHDRLLALDWQYPLVWLGNRIPVLSSYSLRDKPAEFLYHYDNKTFDRILTVQRLTVNFKDGGYGLAQEDDFGPAVKLERIADRQFAIGYRLVISEVKSIDHVAFLAWAETKQKEAKLRLTQASATESSTAAPGSVDIIRVSLSEWVKNLP